MITEFGVSRSPISFKIAIAEPINDYPKMETSSLSLFFEEEYESL